MSVEVLHKVGEQGLSKGVTAQPSLSRRGHQMSENAFAAACEAGRCFIVANQTGVTSQAGLSGTTPVLTLWNPADSGVNARIWCVSAHFEVAFAAAASVWVAVGTNRVAAVVTGTLTTAHRNLKMGGTNAQGNKCVPMLAATLPAAPVAVALLGVGLTGAITTAPALLPMTRWFDGGFILQPGCNLSVQTSTASGTSSTLCEYVWEECEI